MRQSFSKALVHLSAHILHFFGKKSQDFVFCSANALDGAQALCVGAEGEEGFQVYWAFGHTEVIGLTSREEIRNLLFVEGACLKVPFKVSFHCSAKGL